MKVGVDYRCVVWSTWQHKELLEGEGYEFKARAAGIAVLSPGILSL
jgi:hypothetical protein